MNRTPEPFPDRIPSLDGLRAVAIAVVTLGHVVHAPGSPVPVSWHAAKFLAAPGVDLFFVISGFLITHLLLREYAREGRISLGGFWLRRSLRVLPAYFLFLAALFAANRAGLFVVDSRAWLPALTYTYNLFSGHDGAGVGHVWSLCVEEHFYLLWPLGLVLLGRLSAPALLLLALIACPVLRLALWGRPGPDIDYFTPTRIDTIAVGCLLAYFVDSPRSFRVVALLRRRGGAVVLLCAVTMLLSVYLPHQPGKYTLGFKRAFEAVVIATLVLAAVCSSTGFVGRLLNWRPVVAVGTLSYSLYLAQPLAVAGSSPGWPLSWWWNVPLVAAYAVVSYFLVERPFLRLKGRIGRHRDASILAPKSAELPPIGEPVAGPTVSSTGGT